MTSRHDAAEVTCPSFPPLGECVVAARFHQVFFKQAKFQVIYRESRPGFDKITPVVCLFTGCNHGPPSSPLVSPLPGLFKVAPRSRKMAPHHVPAGLRSHRLTVPFNPPHTAVKPAALLATVGAGCDRCSLSIGVASVPV